MDDEKLDQAVAEAVEPYCTVGMCASSGCIDIPASEYGDTAETDPDVLAVWKWNGERNWRTLPKFSTDLNAAFAAAEKVGLFDDDGQDAVLAKNPDGNWEVFWHIGGEVAVQGKTPALAICDAILAIVGNKNKRPTGKGKIND